MSVVVERAYLLNKYKEPGVAAIVILPESTDADVVTAAWAYALRHTAEGLDLPNYQAAIQLMLERHPSWVAVESKEVKISVKLEKADDDEPEKNVELFRKET